MIPLLAFFLYCPFEGRNVWACGVFILASFTDFLDGWLARRWGLSSPFGAFIDPVADKLMVATALVLLSKSCAAAEGFVEVAAALTIAREVGVSALREWMAERGVRSAVQVGFLGKCKTATQMVAISGLLLSLPSTSPASLVFGVSVPGVYLASVALLWLSTALALISGFIYLRAAWPSLST